MSSLCNPISVFSFQCCLLIRVQFFVPVNKYLTDDLENKENVSILHCKEIGPHGLRDRTVDKTSEARQITKD
jgi:hypothetical protein